MKVFVRSFLAVSIVALTAGIALAEPFPTSTDEARALNSRRQAQLESSFAAPVREHATLSPPTTTDQARAEVASAQAQVASTFDVSDDMTHLVAMRPTTTDEARGLVATRTVAPVAAGRARAVARR